MGDGLPEMRLTGRSAALPQAMNRLPVWERYRCEIFASWATRRSGQWEIDPDPYPLFPGVLQENALVLANGTGRVPFVVDPANACTTWLKTFLAKVVHVDVLVLGDRAKRELARVSHIEGQ